MYNVEQPSPNFTPLTEVTRLYSMAKYQVGVFLKNLSRSSFLTDLSALFSNPIDNIVSLRMYPFNVNAYFSGSDDTRVIQAGKVSIELENGDLTSYVQELTKYSGFMISMGEIGVLPYFNSYLDYAPYTKMELYIPYVGFVNIDPSRVLGHVLKLTYAVDYLTGGCTAYVLSDDAVIMMCDGTIGIDIPITARNSAEIAKNNLMTGVGAIGGIAATVGGVASGNIGAIALGATLTSTALGVVNANQERISGGTFGSGFNALYAPQVAFVRITRPVISEPDNYAHYYGRPSAKTAKLNTLTGFTKVASVHVEGLGTATQDEIAEVERLLMSGVIL